jgi:hypothetical protein
MQIVEQLQKEYNDVMRSLKWTDSSINIILNYKDTQKKALLFTISDNKNIYQFVINYENNYPTGGVYFSADWTGECKTSEFCYWIDKVSQEVNVKPITLRNALQIIIKWYKQTQIEYGRWQKLMKGTMDDEFEEYDIGVEETSTRNIGVTLNSLPTYLLKKYNGIKSIIEVVPERFDLFNVFMRVGRYDIQLRVDMTSMSEEIPPIITVITPRIKFDGSFPITPYGLLILDFINPKQWKNWHQTQIINGGDMDFLEIVYNTFVDKNFILDDYIAPYNQEESLLGYSRLLPSLSLNLWSKNMVAEKIRGEGNDIRLPVSIYHFILEHNLGESEKPLFEIETTKGLKTVCGLGEGHELGENLVLIPENVLKNLLLLGTNISPKVNVSFTTLDLADVISIRPILPDSIETIDRESLEKGLSKYTALTEGEIIDVSGIQLEIIKCTPTPSVRTSRFGEIEVKFDPRPSIRELSRPLTPIYDPLEVPPYSFETEESDEEDSFGYQFSPIRGKTLSRRPTVQQLSTTQNVATGRRLSSPTSPRQSLLNSRSTGVSPVDITTPNRKISSTSTINSFNRRISPTSNTTSFNRRVSPVSTNNSFNRRISPTSTTNSFNSRVSPVSTSNSFSRRVSPNVSPLTRPSNPSLTQSRRSVSPTNASLSQEARSTSASPSYNSRENSMDRYDDIYEEGLLEVNDEDYDYNYLQ